MLAMRMCKRLKDGIVEKLGIVDIYRCPTVRALAEHCAVANGPDTRPSVGGRRAELRRARRGAGT